MEDEWVDVYYKRLLKLTNYLQVKVINVFLTTIFKAGLQPYLKLATTFMTRNTLIKHKEVVVIYEKNGPVIVNYSALITQSKSKLVAQPIVHYTITK
jgi:hypothetical protein